MQFSGTISKIMPARTGKGAKGEWVSQTFELTYQDGQFPKKIAFDVFGEDKLRDTHISLNEKLLVDIDFTTREYKGGLYNSVNAWRVTRLNDTENKNEAPTVAAADRPPF